MPALEFGIIDRYFRRRAHRDDVRLGIGDDAALLSVPPGMELVAAVDSIVSGVHFPHGSPAADVGYRALAVNLSDFAAMGAEPRWATLALTLPCADLAWVEECARGFFSLAEAYGVELVGGDTTRGPLTLSVQLLGTVPPRAALRREGARPGDLIFVSGSLGDAAEGLAVLQERNTDAAAKPLADRFRRPEPRVALGLHLRGVASAAIDISDGLVADLGHVLEASGVGATLSVDALPLSAALTQRISLESAWQRALTGGDDYELCFTVPPAAEGAARSRAQAAGCSIARIGTVDAASGLRIRGPDGLPYALSSGGFNHFN